MPDERQTRMMMKTRKYDVGKMPSIVLNAKASVTKTREAKKQASTGKMKTATTSARSVKREQPKNVVTKQQNNSSSNEKSGKRSQAKRGKSVNNTVNNATQIVKRKSLGKDSNSVLKVPENVPVASQQTDPIASSSSKTPRKGRKKLGPDVIATSKDGKRKILDNDYLCCNSCKAVLQVPEVKGHVMGKCGSVVERDGKKQTVAHFTTVLPSSVDKESSTTNNEKQEVGKRPDSPPEKRVFFVNEKDFEKLQADMYNSQAQGT